MEWVIQLPILFFSVVVHEFCHGWVAYACGDDTAEKSGRLTLNPIPHIDAFGTVFLPLLCFLTQAPMFGWAKPVPVNPKRLKDPVRDLVRVAAAGPLSNIVIALGSAVFYKLASVLPGFTPAFRGTVQDVLLFAIMINLFLAFFNLVPVIPLDGSKVVSGLLPRKLSKLYQRHAPYSMFIILAILFTKLNLAILWPMKMALKFLAVIGLLS